MLSVSAAGLAGTNIVASYNAATETLTLSGTDTLAHYSQALEHVTFQTTNFGLDRAQTIEWQLNDGAAANNLSDACDHRYQPAAAADATTSAAMATATSCGRTPTARRRSGR